MKEDILARIFEHNNWANLNIIQACSALSAEQLDAEPHSATFGSIRQALVHLVSAQNGYLSLLTVPYEQRTRQTVDFPNWRTWRSAAAKDCWRWQATQLDQPSRRRCVHETSIGSSHG